MPTAPSAPAPAAPAPAPAAPASQAPAAPASAPNPKAPSPAKAAELSAAARERNDSMFTRLQERADREPVNTPNPPKAPAAPAEPPSAPPAKPAEAVTAAKPPAGTVDKSPTAPAQLRKAYEDTKTRLATVEREFAEFKAKPVEDPEKAKLSETLTAREKRLQEVEDELRFVAFEKHPDYQEQYWKPYQEAFNRGRNVVEQMQATQSDGSLRAGTAEDFDAIVSNPSYAASREMAKAMFPDDWQLIMTERQSVLNINSKRVEAIEKYRKEGGEREKQRQEAAQVNSKKILEAAGQAWKKHQMEPMEKFPQFFKPIEGDETGNKLLEKGWAEASEAFRNMNAFDPRLSPEQREKVIQQHATMFNKAAAFNRLAHQLSAERKHIKALEAKLKEYEDSQPKDTNGHTRAPGAPSESVVDRLSRYAT